MYIGRIMHTNLITIGPDTSLVEAKKVMDENPIEHLLVVDKEGKLLGILSDRDLKQYWASPATTLSHHELAYLLEQVRADMVMGKTVITVTPDMTVERAAFVMQVNNISALPVEENGKLVGIITPTDVMGVLLNAIGMSDASVRLAVFVKDSIGTLAKLTHSLQEQEVNIQSVFSWPIREYPGITQLVFRFSHSDKQKAIQSLEKEGFKVATKYEKDITPFLPKS